LLKNFHKSRSSESITTTGFYPAVVFAQDSFTFDKSGLENWGSGSWECLLEEFQVKQNIEVIPYNPLLSCCPNPFNNKAVITYSLPQDADVSLIIFNLQGRELQSLANGQWSSGKHSVTWNAEGMASGIYFVRLKCEDFSQTRKMVLMK
jgi:hypothetical protein